MLKTFDYFIIVVTIHFKLCATGECNFCFLLSHISDVIDSPGNVVNGTIGKQMVDTLVESASNVEVRPILLIFSNTIKGNY